MSDSSSVDRWHPSNVEWPEQANPPGPVQHIVWPLDRECVTVDIVPFAAYEALYADRGRVLAAARELAEAVEYATGLHSPARSYLPRLGKALAKFREVDHG